MVQTIRDFCSRVPWVNRVASLNILESHDTARILTLVGGDPGKLEAALALLMTMPGVPMVEYGGEVGMEGLNGEDGRRPMPWPGQAGSKSGAQTKWNGKIHRLYQDLIHLRRSLPALQEGGLRWLVAEDDAVVFLRESAGQTALVHVARAAHDPIKLDVRNLQGLSEATTVFGLPPEAQSETLLLEADGPGARVLVW